MKMIRTIDNLSHQRKLKIFFFSLARRRLREYMILVSTLVHKIPFVGGKNKELKRAISNE